MKFGLLGIPFAGAVSEATGTILEKKILKQPQIDYKDYAVFGFLAIVLLVLPLVFMLGEIFPDLFAFSISSEALQFNNLMIMALVIFFSALANFFVFYAMKWENITEIEPIRLFQPLFVIIFAFFLYSTERQVGINIIIASLVAAGAIIFSHIRKEHLKLNKYAIAALFGSLFFAIELALSKQILNFYSPIAFYLIRCSIILIFSYLIFIPSASAFDEKTWLMTFITAAIWILYRVLLYFSYGAKGVIITTLLFILAPVFIYLFSYIFLGERPTWRNIVSSMIIIACVAYAMFAGA